MELSKNILQNHMDLALESAKKNLIKDGGLNPVAILYDNYSIKKIINMSNEIDETDGYDKKSKFVFMAGGVAGIINATIIIFVFDAAMKAIEDPKLYDCTMSPLTYPKSMRTECIIVNGVDLKSKQEKTVIAPYVGGGKDGPVKFISLKEALGSESESNELTESQSRFPRLAVMGYKSSKNILSKGDENGL